MKRKKALLELNNQEAVQSWKALMFAYRATFNKLEKGLDNAGFSIPKFQILYMLYFDGPLQLVEIATRSKVSKANISTFINRMKRDNLVEEHYEQSRKLPKVKLSTNGVKEFEILFPGHVERTASLVPPMTPDIVAYLKDLENRNTKPNALSDKRVRRYK